MADLTGFQNLSGLSPDLFSSASRYSVFLFLNVIVFFEMSPVRKTTCFNDKKPSILARNKRIEQPLVSPPIYSKDTLLA